MGCGGDKPFRNTETERINFEGDKIAQSLYGKNTFELAKDLNIEEAEKVGLERGVYKITAKIPYSGVGETIRGVQKSINQNEEFKRVRFDKIDIVPIKDTIDGDPAGKLTIVAEVIDNPIWLPALVYGGTAIAGLTGTWFVVDKVQEFSTESIIPLGALVLTGIGIFLALKK